MSHRIKVTPKDGTAAGWIVECFNWRDEHDTSPDAYPIQFVKQGADFVADVDFVDGINSIECTLLGGREVEIDLVPGIAIFQPPGKTWPRTLKLAAAMPRDIFPTYFRVGGEA